MARCRPSPVPMLTAVLAGWAVLATPSVSVHAATHVATQQGGGNLTLQPGPEAQKWWPGRKSKRKERRFRARRGSKRPGTLTVNVENGRGSVFVNGRWAGTAPLQSYSVPAGKNDIQVRDGSTVLAEGLLFVPYESDVTATVTHP